MSAFYVDKSVNVGTVPVHAVYAFRYNQRSHSVGYSFCRKIVELGIIIMAETGERNARKAYAVDYACMHQSVGNYEYFSDRGQRRN